MPHLLESAPTGRSKCRGCSGAIDKGSLRFGERVPNPFADGETTLWFHPLCAAYKRSEALLQALGECTTPVPEREALERAARGSLAHRRLPRIDGAERAPGGQARCRHCRELIAKGTWRIRLVFHDEGRPEPGGFIHLACWRGYFEVDDILDHVLHFSPELSAPERVELTVELNK